MNSRLALMVISVLGDVWVSEVMLGLKNSRAAIGLFVGTEKLIIGWQVSSVSQVNFPPENNEADEQVSAAYAERTTNHEGSTESRKPKIHHHLRIHLRRSVTR